MSNKSCRKSGRHRGERSERPSNGVVAACWRAGTGISLAAALFLAGCQGEVIRHGHVFQEEDLQQIRVGMSRDEVLLALGTPDTQSTVGGSAVYYISTTTERQFAFLDPKVVDRRVVAVYFDENDQVKQIANYGLKDGKVFDFISRTTPPANSYEDGLFKQIFRNLGKRTNIFGS